MRIAGLIVIIAHVEVFLSATCEPLAFCTLRIFNDDAGVKRSKFFKKLHVEMKNMLALHAKRGIVVTSTSSEEKLFQINTRIPM